MAVVCKSDGGNSIFSMLIFNRKRMKQELKDGVPPGSVFACNDSGCMRLEWFDNFLAHVKPTEDDPALLILDGHLSHTKNLEVIVNTRENFLSILCLPPHCTHKLQHLDVGVMFPLSHYLYMALEKWMSNHPGRVVTLFQIGYTSVNHIYKPSINGFRKTGIVPYNPDFFTDIDFAAAKTTEHATSDGSDVPDKSIIADGPNGFEQNQNTVLEEQQENHDICQANSHASPSSSRCISPPNAIKPVPKMLVKQYSVRKRTSQGIIVITDSPYKNMLVEDWRQKLEQTEIKAARQQKKQNIVAAQKRSNSNECAAIKCRHIYNVGVNRNRQYQLSASDSELEYGEQSKCNYCTELFSNSLPGEGWLQCVACRMWAHDACASIEVLNEVLTTLLTVMLTVVHVVVNAVHAVLNAVHVVLNAVHVVLTAVHVVLTVVLTVVHAVVIAEQVVLTAVCVVLTAVCAVLSAVCAVLSAVHAVITVVHAVLTVVHAVLTAALTVVHVVMTAVCAVLMALLTVVYAVLTALHAVLTVDILDLRLVECLRMESPPPHRMLEQEVHTYGRTENSVGSTQRTPTRMQERVTPHPRLHTQGVSITLMGHLWNDRTMQLNISQLPYESTTLCKQSARLCKVQTFLAISPVFCAKNKHMAAHGGHPCTGMTEQEVHIHDGYCGREGKRKCFAGENWNFFPCTEIQDGGCDSLNHQPQAPILHTTGSHAGIVPNAATGQRVFSGSPVSPAPPFRHHSILISINLICSEDLAVKNCLSVIGLEGGLGEVLFGVETPATLLQKENILA
ncbi:hypothetical protein PR048_001209, partial [Dryococelus australis]